LGKDEDRVKEKRVKCQAFSRGGLGVCKWGKFNAADGPCLCVKGRAFTGKEGNVRQRPNIRDCVSGGSARKIDTSVRKGRRGSEEGG